MAVEFPLSVFIGQAKAMIALIPDAADQISMASEPRWFGGPMTGEINRLGPVTITWRLQFTKVTSKTILFIFPAGEVKDVLLDATLTTRVCPLGVSEEHPTEFAANSFTVTYPTCLPMSLSETQMNRLGPPGANRENTLFFATGESQADIVAVKDPGKRPSIVYSPKGVPDPVPQGKNYSLAPMLAVLRELVTLVQNEPALGPSVPIEWTASSPVGKILDAIMTAGSESAKSLTSASKKRQHPDWFHSDYRVAQYDADLDASVAADGNLAERTEDEQFKSSLALRMEGNLVRLSLGPPDFALAGEQKETFFAGLLVPMVREALGKMLGCAPGFVGAFLDSARDTGVVVRVRRRSGTEKYLAVFEGRLGDNETRLLLSGEFRVTDAFEADIHTLKGVRYQQPADLVSGDFQVVKYFFELIQNLTLWSRLLSK